MSKRKDACDRHSDRVRWAKAMCDVMIADPDIERVHVEAIAGVSGHLADAMRELEELYQDLPNDGTPVPPARGKRERGDKVVSISKTEPADAEPEHGGAA